MKQITVDIKSYTNELTVADILKEVADKIEDSIFPSLSEITLFDADGAADVFVTVEEREA